MNPSDQKSFLEKAEVILKALQNKAEVSDSQVTELWDNIKDSIDDETTKPFFLFFSGLKDYLTGSPAGTRLEDLENSLNKLIFESKKPQ